MAEGSERMPTCSFHKDESYKYYCKDCKTCICPKCIEELHGDHTFCRIQSAEEDIRRELGTLVSCSGENECDMSSMKQLVKDKLQSLLTHKIDLVKQVEDKEKEIITKVHETKEAAIAEIEDIYNKMSAPSKEQQTRLDKLSTGLTEKDLANMDLKEVIGTVSELKQVLEGIKDSEKETPKRIISKSNSSLLIENLAKTFIEAQEQSCAQVACGECEIHEDEKVSNVKREICPLTIKSNKLRYVRKICPVSLDDALILNYDGLRWIKSNTLDDTVLSSQVKDFAVSPEGKIFLIKERDKFVYRRLDDGRIIPFANVDDGSLQYFPTCLYLLKKYVVVNVCGRYWCKDLEEFQIDRRTDIYTMEGIRTRTSRLNSYKLSPCQYILYCSSVAVNRHYLREILVSSNSTIHVINVYREKSIEEQNINADRVGSFRGKFGAHPFKTFECEGSCADECGNILVSDSSYKCVYALDEDLKYKSMVIDSSEFDLQYPGAIAVADGLLWLADDEKIFKFKYNSRKNTLM